MWPGFGDLVASMLDHPANRPSARTVLESPLWDLVRPTTSDAPDGNEPRPKRRRLNFSHGRNVYAGDDGDNDDDDSENSWQYLYGKRSRGCSGMPETLAPSSPRPALSDRESHGQRSHSGDVSVRGSEKAEAGGHGVNHRHEALSRDLDQFNDDPRGDSGGDNDSEGDDSEAETVRLIKIPQSRTDIPEDHEQEVADDGAFDNKPADGSQSDDSDATIIRSAESHNSRASSLESGSNSGADEQDGSQAVSVDEQDNASNGKQDDVSDGKPGSGPGGESQGEDHENEDEDEDENKNDDHGRVDGNEADDHDDIIERELDHHDENIEHHDDYDYDGDDDYTNNSRFGGGNDGNHCEDWLGDIGNDTSDHLIR